MFLSVGLLAVLLCLLLQNQSGSFASFSSLSDSSDSSTSSSSVISQQPETNIEKNRAIELLNNLEKMRRQGNSDNDNPIAENYQEKEGRDDDNGQNDALDSEEVKISGTSEAGSMENRPCVNAHKHKNRADESYFGLSPSELNAILDLYYCMDGVHWSNPWNINGDPCR